MKFVIFGGTLQEGGAERVISILTKYMIGRGMNVELLLYYDREIFYDLPPTLKLTTVTSNSGSNNILKNIIWMHKYFKKNADVIISFLAPFNIIAILANMFTDKPIIVADRNDPRHIPSNIIVRKLRDILYRFTDGVCVQTYNNQQYFCKAIQKKSKVIYNPVDMGSKSGQALRTEKSRRIVSVGRLTPQKNQKMLLCSFAAIHQQFPEYTLTFYGEGSYRTELENYAESLGISEFVSFPGNSKKVFDDISNAELFVLPSNYEGMPNALIEAMCLGLPVISTRVSGATDLIQNGVNGLLVDVGNEEQLTTAIIDLLANPVKRESYAQNAVSMNNLLKVDDVMEQWISFANEVV